MDRFNYVTSYINPDTDGVACSIAMAKLLTTGTDKWIANILGRIGEETEFVLKKTEILLPTSGSVMDKADKICLVDTHHKSQLPDDFPYDKVVAIIDHHPNGDDDLFPFADITNEKVGAAASLVAKMYLEKDVIDKPIFELLSFAIISNTLNFCAPSSTDFDKRILKDLSNIAPISAESINDMFEQRSLILKKDIYAALCEDLKLFDTNLGKVGISQIEAYNLEALLDVSLSVNVLKQVASDKNLDVCIFNGVDIKNKHSIVIAANSPSQELLRKIFNLPECKEILTFDRILLRKTDFIPYIN